MPDSSTHILHPGVAERARELFTQRFTLVAAFLFAFLLWTYSNHFDNPFHFDDSHTIVNNQAIRDLGNTSSFFMDATTSSTLPANQAWRPGTTLLNAIDTWLSGGVPNARWFHISIFASYILLGVVLFLVFLHVFGMAFRNEAYAKWAALIGAGWFWMHTANAETINYIIARADSFSTLLLLVAFVLYFHSRRARRYYLYLIPIAAGFLVKETTIMFAPMLLAYVWLFGDPDGGEAGVRSGSAGRRHVAASFVLAVALFLLSRAMTPEGWDAGGGAWYRYLATQAFVVVHYFNTFILPVNLSADTDWTLVSTLRDDRVMAGVLFIALLLSVAWKCARRESTRPITFGILWFFLGLAPTSSFMPLAEVLNDHRTFLPYVGLVLAFVTTGVLLFDALVRSGKAHPLARPATAVLLALAFITAHGIGAHHRNKVWHSGLSLWEDVTRKSPGNGRGWMNYGLALMGTNDVQGAVAAYTRALQLYPGYSYAFINMGVAQSRLGQPGEAEANFKAAINADPSNPEGYYYYGMFLVAQNRTAEAVVHLNRGREVSPRHDGINATLARAAAGNDGTSMVAAARTAVASNPTSDNYVNLSLALYNNADYRGSMDAARSAIALKADDPYAWNNVCASSNHLQEWDNAIAACEKAVQLKADFELARNNLAEARRSKQPPGKL